MRKNTALYYKIFYYSNYKYKNWYKIKQKKIQMKNTLNLWFISWFRLYMAFLNDCNCLFVYILQIIKYNYNPRTWNGIDNIVVVPRM